MSSNVFGPTWGRRSRRGWRQGSRGWGEQGQEDEEDEEELMEEEELKKLTFKGFLSSGEELGTEQSWQSTFSYRQLNLHLRQLFGRNRQLEAVVTAQCDRVTLLEEEIIQLRQKLDKENIINMNLRNNLSALENKLTRVPKPPPPPPPPPSKTLMGSVRKTFMTRSKRAMSVPNIAAACSGGMSLNEDVLDAIKNRTYVLRPVTRKGRERRVTEDDLAIGQILKRRMAMGYVMEEDTMSISSIVSGNSFGPINTI